MMPQPSLLLWLTEQMALTIHKRQLAEHGGLVGVRDLGLLASALARPQHLASYGQPDMAALAASYGFGIARNHPFVDGNKRTAYVASRLFLQLNGFDIAATREEKYTTFLTLAEGNLSEDALAAWFRAHLVEPTAPPKRVQEG